MSGETFGGMGKLEWSQGNPDDPNPVWTDITVYLRTEDTPLQITRGRQSELDSIQSSQLTCVLDNTDNRFTPGYTLGPYGANWTSGKKVRYSETLAGVTLILYTGYLEFPDIDDWQPIGLQFVQLTAVDRLTRLQRGRPFVSTLGAQIMGSSAAVSLVAYWPLDDPSARWNNAVGGYPPLLPATSALGFTPAGQLGPPGDDQSFLLVVPPVTASLPAYDLAAASFTTPITVSSGQTVALSMWVRQQLIDPASVTSEGQLVILGDSSALLTSYMQMQADPLTPTFFFFGIAGDLSSSTAAPEYTSPLPNDVWRLITLRVTAGAALVELWRGSDDPVTANIAVPPSSYSFGYVGVGGPYSWGAMAHLQVHVGVNAFTRADHLAQFAHGLSGLEYQSTGQRVNTILDFAGVSGTERLVDPGVDFLQKATLAGLTPADALQTAVDTERARAFIDGQGRYVFQDRAHTYNV